MFLITSKLAPFSPFPPVKSRFYYIGGRARPRASAGSIRSMSGFFLVSSYLGGFYQLTRRARVLRACFKIRKGPAARDFGRGRGGEFRASPQRAVRSEPTTATGKRPAARRVFAQKAVWLRCSSVTDPSRVCSFVAPRHPAFCPKTDLLPILKQALSFHHGTFAWFFKSGQ
jgi:hypothetical protein